MPKPLKNQDLSPTPGVARFTGYMAICSFKDGGFEWLGTYRRWRDCSDDGYSSPFSLKQGDQKRPHFTHDLSDGLQKPNGPSVFFDRARLEKVIANSILADTGKPKTFRRKFRIVPVVIEIKLRERAPVGYVVEPSFIRTFRQLVRHRKPQAKKKAFTRRNVL